MKPEIRPVCYTEQHSAVRQGKFIKSGGTGSANILADIPVRIVKIYHSHIVTGAYPRKLSAVLAHYPLIPTPAGGESVVQLSWPDYRLFDERNRVTDFARPFFNIRCNIELDCDGLSILGEGEHFTAGQFTSPLSGRAHWSSQIC